MSLSRLSTYQGLFPFIVFLLALVSPVMLSAAQDGYPAKIRTARSTWQRDSNRISELLEKLRDNATACNRLDKDIAASQDEIRQVEDDLAEQLREMAEGKFCSKCLRNASQIERGGETFFYHLREVGGIMVPASQEQFEKARQSAAEKIASIRKRIGEKQADKKKALAALNDALHQLNVAIAAYHRDITTEKDIQIASWASEANDWENKLTEQQAQLDALVKQPEAPARDIQIRAVDAQLRSSLTSTSTAELRAAQTATAFNQAVRKDMDYLAKKAETIPSGQPLVDGWFIGKNITSQNITYVAGPVRRPQSSGTTQILKGASKPSMSSTDAPEKSISDLLKGK